MDVFFITSHPSVQMFSGGQQPYPGFFPGSQAAGSFFTGNQPGRDQIFAEESISAAHIAKGSSIRAKQLCAAFIGQEPGYQAPAGSITGGKLSVDSIITGSSPAGPITAGELRIGSIGPGRASAEYAEQDLSDQPQGKGDKY